MSARRTHYDVVVVGAGHNGLVAAAYLGRAGLSVLVLERLADVGGAAVSAPVFAGHDARVPRFSDGVRLPERLVEDLGLDLRLATPSPESYTPTLRDGHAGGLLVGRPEGPETAASFEELTGGPEEYDAWRELHADLADLAHVVAPTLLEPLPTERALRERVDPGLWRDFVTTPLGVTVETRFTDDTVRGTVAAEALDGSFTSLHDPSLSQNRSFLYRRIGSSGCWRMPVGGTGALSGALGRATVAAEVELVTLAGVSAIRGDDGGAEVDWHDGTRSHTVSARHVLAGVAPWVLQILLGDPDDPETKPHGAQLKINALLERLPRLRSGVDPEVAFGGTLRVGAGYDRLEQAHAEAAAGHVPSVVPGELHCPSLTDPSILGADADGRHVLSWLGMHTPAFLFETDRAAATRQAVDRSLAALDEHLEEPIADCLARDSAGNPCLEALTPQDVEAALAMPGGHPHHGDLEWPWAPNRARLETPAQQWGVQTDRGSVLVCGSGARRGGAVSGLGGHNAAMAVLASR